VSQGLSAAVTPVSARKVVTEAKQSHLLCAFMNQAGIAESATLTDVDVVTQLIPKHQFDV